MFGKKKIKVTLQPLPEPTLRHVQELDRLATEIQAITGFTLEELKGMFLAGYTLQAPKQMTMEELLGELEKEAYESM